jgi:hypothetical protein
MLIGLRRFGKCHDYCRITKVNWPRYVNMLKLQCEVEKSEYLKAKTEIVPIQRLDARNMAMRLMFSVFINFFSS